MEIDGLALKNNVRHLRSLLGKETKLWAVVKSNAYGHGLVEFSQLAGGLVDGFCVDSLVEGQRLRLEGIKKPILVLGPTFNSLLPNALNNDLTLSVASWEALRELLSFKKGIAVHLKIDSGMHRQGFYLKDLPRVIKLAGAKLKLTGVYTHFAVAKDPNHSAYTNQQFKEFLSGVKLLKKAGFRNLIVHAAATNGTLADKKYHLDAVRIGIGLYGVFHSGLAPVLSWRTVVSDVKSFSKGDLIGYDLTERMKKDGRLAVLPIGYWHGLPRSLSSKGEVLIKGNRARILGRISMDLAVADVTGIDCRYGDEVTVIGRQGTGFVGADEVAEKAGTISYEILTRINPLIKRLVK